RPLQPSVRPAASHDVAGFFLFGPRLQRPTRTYDRPMATSAAHRRIVVALLVSCGLGAAVLRAQQQNARSAVDRQRRIDMEAELQSIAVVERKVMMAMPDGVRLATDIYRPKNAAAKVPIIWVRTPYDFNFWDVQNGVPADITAPLTAVKRGYAYVVQNERGHFFSE